MVAVEVAVIAPAGDSPAWGGGYVYLYHVFIVGGICAAGYGGGTFRITIYVDVVGGIGLKDGLVETGAVLLKVEAADESGLSPSHLNVFFCDDL